MEKDMEDALETVTAYGEKSGSQESKRDVIIDLGIKCFCFRSSICCSARALLVGRK